jgi:N-acetylglucosamine kinase-like BadF-type ATPase
MYALGIDGGGTKTQAVIMDGAGEIVGEGFGGVGNYNLVGVEGTRASVADAVAEARQAAGLDKQSFDGVFLGMASVVSPTDRAVIHDIGMSLDLAASDRIGVDHDCRIALAGGLSGRAGIVQICGTGSSTFGINHAGEGWRTGGWGKTISDEGSGYWLGVQAMRSAVRAFDGRDSETLLLPRVLDHLQIDHINDIYQPLYINGLTKTDIAKMAPMVMEAALEGDAKAIWLIEQGTGLMAECVEAAARVLGMTGEPIEVALAGGTFSAGEIFVRPFRQAVEQRLPGSVLVHAEQPPVVGAGILALRMARA